MLIADRYQVERQLGWGGGGTVYLVRDTLKGGKKVALKVAGLGKDPDPLSVATLKNEFSTLSKLSHRNLAQVYDFGITAREIFFTSEWVDGVDLLRATRGLNLNAVFQLMVQVFRAVDYLHRRGVLHLDLKPANILVTDPDRTGDLVVKVIDFGMNEWKRPEKGKGETGTGLSDIYSLGIVFFQVFFRRLPTAGEVPPFHSALPREFSATLLKMASPDPAERYPTIAKVLEAVNDDLGENFSLRPPTAPIGILEESDYLFRRKEIDEWVEAFSRGEANNLAVEGPEGIGKSFFLTKVKEHLQLRGIHPWLSEDGHCLSLGSSPETQPPRPLELKPLPDARILEFLESEIENFPKSTPGAELVALSKGNPARLESLLQGMREEGAIQWTDRGWRFQEEIPLEVSGILARAQDRWRRRLAEVQGVLKFSRVGLNAKVLEGILGMEPGALGQRLRDWALAGEILSRWEEGEELFFPPREQEAGAPVPPSADWGWIEHELERLYQEDEYEKGSQFAELILANDSPSANIPSKVRLLAARHCAAFGDPQKALGVLGSAVPSAPEQAGLFYEITARCHWLISGGAQIEEALAKAESFYGLAASPGGLSAVHNLRALHAASRNDLAAADTHFQMALEKAREAKDPYPEALIETNRGGFYQDQGKVESAQACYERAMELSPRFHHPQLACVLRHNWVNLLHHSGKAREAETACFEWLRLAIASRYPQQQAAALNYLSLFAEQEGRREKQLAYLNQALGLLPPGKYLSLAAQILINRSYAYWDLKKFLPAELDAQAALQLAEKIGKKFLIALSCLSYGKVLRDRSHPDYSESAKFLQRAREIILEGKNLPLLWEVGFEQGMLAKRQNQKVEAREFFLRAREVLEKFLEGLSEEGRRDFLRDRKLEKVEAELKKL